MSTNFRKLVNTLLPPCLLDYSAIPDDVARNDDIVTSIELVESVKVYSHYTYVQYLDISDTDTSSRSVPPAKHSILLDRVPYHISWAFCISTDISGMISTYPQISCS